MEPQMGPTFVVEFAPEVTYSYFVPFRDPRAPQRRPKGAKRAPQGSPRTQQGTNIYQKLTKITFKIY